MRILFAAGLAAALASPAQAQMFGGGWMPFGANGLGCFGFSFGFSFGSGNGGQMHGYARGYAPPPPPWPRYPYSAPPDQGTAYGRRAAWPMSPPGVYRR